MRYNEEPTTVLKIAVEVLKKQEGVSDTVSHIQRCIYNWMCYPPSDESLLVDRGGEMLGQGGLKRSFGTVVKNTVLHTREHGVVAGV